MIRFNVADLQSAIRWLTTTTFAELPFELLAVVLDERKDQGIHVLLENPDVIERLHFNTHALLLSVTEQAETPQMPFPIQDEKSNQWVMKLREVTPIFYGKNGNHFQTTLKLLNIFPDTLPVVYLRFKGLSPMYLPIESNEKTIDCLSDLFDKMGRLSLAGTHATFEIIEKILCRHNMYAVKITEKRQQLLDKGIEGKMTSCSKYEEFEVCHILDDAGIAQPQVDHILKEIDGFPYRHQDFPYHTLITKVRPLLPEHLQNRLRSTVLAHLMEDYATVATNLCAIIEGSLSGSITQVVRGDFGIDLPTYNKRYDPNKGSCKISGIEINGFGAVMGDTSAARKIRWKAPMLREQLILIPKAAEIEELSLELNQKGWESLQSIASTLAQVRNPAAHGEELTESQAHTAWKQLQAWYDFGCANALFEIRQSIANWPLMKSDALQQIRSGYHIQRNHQETVLKSWIQKAKSEIAQYPEPHRLEQNTNSLKTLQEELHPFQSCTDRMLFLRFPINNDLLKQYANIESLQQDLFQIHRICNSRNRLRQKLSKYIQPTGNREQQTQTYQRLGKILISSTCKQTVLDQLKKMEVAGEIGFRKKNAQTYIEQQLTEIEQNANILMQYDQSWLQRVHRITKSMYQDITDSIAKNERVIEEQEFKRSQARQIYECAYKLHANFTNGSPMDCMCKQHDLDLLWPKPS